MDFFRREFRRWGVPVETGACKTRRLFAYRAASTLQDETLSEN